MRSRLYHESLVWSYIRWTLYPGSKETSWRMSVCLAVYVCPKNTNGPDLDDFSNGEVYGVDCDRTATKTALLDMPSQRQKRSGSRQSQSLQRNAFLQKQYRHNCDIGSGFCIPSSHLGTTRHSRHSFRLREVFRIGSKDRSRPVGLIRTV